MRVNLKINLALSFIVCISSLAFSAKIKEKVMIDKVGSSMPPNPIQVDVDRLETDDYEYDFTVDITDPTVTNTRVIVINFDDGTTGTAQNGVVKHHVYPTPIASTDHMNPYVTVTTKNQAGNVVDIQVVGFEEIVLPAPDPMELEISVTQNIVELYINEPVILTATVTDKVGTVRFDWVVSFTEGDIQQPCTVSGVGTCVTYINQSTTPSMNFTVKGTYIAFVYATDQAGNQGVEKYFINVSEHNTPCVYGAMMHNACYDKYNFPLGSTLHLMEMGSLTNYFNSPCMTPWSTPNFPVRILDGIASVEWFLDQNSIKHTTFTANENEYYLSQNHDVCVELNTVGKHMIEVEFRGGILGTANGPLNPSSDGMAILRISKEVNVVDITQSIAVNQGFISNFPEYAQNSFIFKDITIGGINPSGYPTLDQIIPAQKQLDLVAFHEIRLKDGFQALNGCNFSAVVTDDYNAAPGCSCTPKKSMMITAEESTENESDQKGQVRLFPNPTNGTFTIDYGNDLSPGDKVYIEILNSLGQGVIKTYTIFQEIDLSDQPKGIYLVKINNVTKGTLQTHSLMLQ